MKNWAWKVGDALANGFVYVDPPYTFRIRKDRFVMGWLIGGEID
jgi:hypothetical protein